MAKSEIMTCVDEENVIFIIQIRRMPDPDGGPMGYALDWEYADGDAYSEGCADIAECFRKAERMLGNLGYKPGRDPRAD